MKKTKLTRNLLAACSIVALSVALSGCLHSSDDPVTMDDPPVDTDGDGTPDADDAFPDDPDEDTDTDGDGVGDNADAFPDDPDEDTDTDGDGIGDNADAHNVPNDRDNDGVADVADAFPDDPTETRDSDDDGVGNNADAFPLDPMETADSDGDGTGDNADVFPMDPMETADSDGDGTGDNADAFPMDPMETADSDGDGTGDNADAFPMDPMETADSDGDGTGDNADAFPNDPDETADSDGDMVGDNADAFPNDPDETADSDGDMVGDNADAFPNDPDETADSDGDMVGDNADAFPNDPDETADSDGDMVGDNADAFPNDPTETADTDGDGVGDNAQAAAERAAAIVAATASAATKTTAIRTEAAQTIGGTVGTDGAGGDDAGLGGSGPPSAIPTAGQVAGEYNLAIEYGSATITVEAAAADDNVMFTDAEAGLDRGRTMLMLESDPDMMTGEIEREIAVVGTDIDPDEDVPFEDFEVHTLSGGTVTVSMPQELGVRDLDDTVDADMDEIATNDFTALEVDQADADVRALVASSAFTSATQSVLTFPDDDTTTANMDEASEVAGTYNGTPGTYRCNGSADCTVSLDAMGMITAMSDGWIFTPDTGATTAQPDYEYLSYGFWLQQTEDSDGAITYDEIETFAMAHGYAEATSAGIGAVTGTASYSGDTVGVYVRNVTDSQGGIVSSTSGHFVADVTLDASFGGGNVRQFDQFTIGGMIEHFELSGGEEVDWDVTLGLADFSGGRDGGGEPGMSAPGNSHTAAFIGKATGDMAAMAGSWNGTFHGASGQITPTGAVGTVNTPPSAVTGEFNANFTDGNVAGGFGATVDEE